MELILILLLMVGICISVVALCEKDKRKSYHSSVDNNYVLFGKVIMVAISNNGDSKEEKCQVCYKTFTNKADVHSIIMTNMCENC